jgi:hypothetical protein
LWPMTITETSTSFCLDIGVECDRPRLPSSLARASYQSPVIVTGSERAARCPSGMDLR